MSEEAVRWAYVLDDDSAFRDSLVSLLDLSGWQARGFGSPGDFGAAAGTLEPGILLLDVNLGGDSGIDILETMLEVERFVVVMITGAGEVQTAVRAMKAGAADFIEKPFKPNELLDRIDGIHDDLVGKMSEKSARAEARRKVETLSGRERDVLERLLSGASNKLIARDLELSPRTVEMHRARMLHKLGVGTTTEALDLGRSAQVPPVAIG